MKRQTLHFPSSCGRTQIDGLLWLPDDEAPVAVVQIVHGMLEHIGRYERFASFLCAQGYAVCGHNHLGHGDSLIEGKAGYFGGKQGADFLLRDLDLLRRQLDERFAGLPHFLFGHSMGSFLTRLYLPQRAQGLAGVVLSGTSGPQPVARLLGIPLAGGLWRVGGDDYRCPRLDHLLSGGYARVFTDTKSPHGWLSTDPEEVRLFDEDPKTQFIFTVSAYHTLFDMLCKVSDPHWAQTLPKSLPVLLLSGDHDPVGQFARGVLTVARRLEDAGLTDLTLQLYAGRRHELLNESNRDDVHQFLLTWLERRAKTSAE